MLVLLTTCGAAIDVPIIPRENNTDDYEMVSPKVLVMEKLKEQN